MDGRSLCAYNMFIRPAYVDAVLSLPWSDAAADRGASWGSLKNILLHIVEVEEWWFHHVAAGRKEAFDDWGEYERFDSADAVRKQIGETEKKTRAFLEGLDDDDLLEPVTVTPEDGPPMNYRLEDLLVHVAVEEVHHRGELIALLWQMDREPPPMTYRYWINHVTGQARTRS